MKPFEITTHRLVLRKIGKDDTQRVFEACTDETTLHYLIRIPDNYTIEDANKFIARTDQLWEKGDILRWGIYFKDEEKQKLLGSIELRKENGYDSFGVWTHPDSRGKGIMSEAVHAAAVWANENKFCKNNEIYYACMASNVGSEKVAKKAGFVFGGTKMSEPPYVLRSTGEPYEYKWFRFVAQ